MLAGTIPVFLAVAAILGWRLPADEIAHPLDPAGRRAGARYSALSSSVTSATDFLASPNSMEVFSA